MANKEVDLQDRSKMDYENIQNIQFYAASTIRRIFFIFGCFASLGVLKLISHWIKTLFIILNYNKVPIKHRIDYKAVKAIIKDAYGQIIICDHTIRNIQGKQVDGLKQDDVQQIADHNGENSIEIPVPPLFSIIIDEGLNPFIFFQLFSITVWLCIDYYIYASVIAIITTISVFLSVYQTRRNLIDLHDKTLTEAKLVTVFRRGGDNQSNKININTKELLPGDVYEVNDGDIMPCDSLLLSGNCVVDESMLTGESNAVIKTEIPHIINSQKSEQSDDELTDNQNQQNNELLDIDHHKQYILFGGTHVIRSRNISTETGDNTSSRAFVLRTGFSTAKGQLVRSILFPKPTTFKFYEDSFKFVGVMGILAVIGFIITGIAQYHYGASWFDIFFRAADLVTIAVPPQLPVVISSAQGYSIRRLKMKNIFCIAPQRINFAGKVKVVCFDKTGTLTEDGLGVKAH
ncbi:MAG: putative Cation-transporting ATPase 13A2 [Streblomastix strix]|uniref:Cation-transporting ATPase n=1 Tax=Streblomastix strix TaxID=222440 RepID=A0A5J4VWW7_9EUKA|nr:MAG: putative Cation-transporting ATPase 13A2 [Streblomastix strix]